jgi:hypothetical protein
LKKFDDAEQHALEMKMRPAIWQARTGAAHTLSALGHMEEAGAKQRAAHRMVDEIAALFKDAELRKLFIENAQNKT